MFNSCVTYKPYKPEESRSECGYYEATRDIIERLLNDLRAAELCFQEEKRLRLYAEEEFGNAKLEAEKLRDEYDRKKRFYWEEDEADGE